MSHAVAYPQQVCNVILVPLCYRVYANHVDVFYLRSCSQQVEGVSRILQRKLQSKATKYIKTMLTHTLFFPFFIVRVNHVS